MRLILEVWWYMTKYDQPLFPILLCCTTRADFEAYRLFRPGAFHKIWRAPQMRFVVFYVRGCKQYSSYRHSIRLFPTWQNSFGELSKCSKTHPRLLRSGDCFAKKPCPKQIKWRNNKWISWVCSVKMTLCPPLGQVSKPVYDWNDTWVWWQRKKKFSQIFESSLMHCSKQVFI